MDKHINEMDSRIKLLSSLLKIGEYLVNHNLRHKIERKIKQLISNFEYYEKLILVTENLYSLQRLVGKIHQLNKKIKLIKEELNNLHLKHNIQLCDKCTGVGYIKIKKEI
jgi:hypothetical protein